MAQNNNNKGFKILLVEDDPNFGSILNDFLRMYDHDVDLAVNGKLGLEKFREKEYDLALLDVMMPEMDGFALAEKIRAEKHDFPFLFLTAKSLKDDVMRGFSLGADDYIIKPFDSEILIMKINAVMNRRISSPVPETEYQIGRALFKPKYRSLLLPNGEEKVLSPKEGELLTLLCMYKNDILKRSEALRRIWKEDSYFTGRSMDVYIAKLRKYFKDESAVEILNIHSEGFRLIDRTDTP